MKSLRPHASLLMAAVLSAAFVVLWLPASASEPPESKKAVSFSEGFRETMIEEASRVGRELQGEASSLFTREPLGWNLDTIDAIYNWFLFLPLRIPEILDTIREQSRLLGAAGSLFILALIVAVLYSLIWQKRVLAMVERQVAAFKPYVADEVFPFLLSVLRIVVASLVPLLLLGGFFLVNAFIAYRAPWFLFLERALILWTIGALMLHFLSELLVQDRFQVASTYGRMLMAISRGVVLYILLAVGIIWGAAAFQVRGDVQAFIRFVISLTIVCALIPLLLKKRALLSLLPELPYRTYQRFVAALDRFYFPVIFFTFLTGLLWCFGYERFSRMLWTKTWAVAGVFVLIMIAYHLVNRRLTLWAETKDKEDEDLQFLFSSLRSLLVYATVLAILLATLQLLGILEPIQRILSFPVVTIGTAPISVWIVTKAVIILIAVVYLTRLLQAYLNYRIFPGLGIDPGLAYVINTFLKYTGLVFGVLISLTVVGIDFRIFMVFAGAIGIGVGLGLQSMASNVISGFTLIFGRKLRKDDWIQVGDTRGVVTDIFLRATKVRTRDHIEYLIPNSSFIENTFVNYTLTAPTIRIRIPVRVAFSSDPGAVRRVLEETAGRHPEVCTYRDPEVSFLKYGDSAVHFELLVWIDIRKLAEWRIRSRLYFDIFEAFRKEGIEVPYPQRDLHLRSGAEITTAKRDDTG